MKTEPRGIYQVDAFTDSLFSGNPAGVVYPADRLEEITMQALSAELNNSETAFVYNVVEGAPIRIRFFTPTMEVPLCTHATIAAFHVLRSCGIIDSGTYLMDCTAGLMPVGLEDGQIKVTQNPVQFLTVLDEKLIQLLGDGLRIEREDMIGEVQVVSTGNPKVLVQLRSKEVLNNVTYDEHILRTLGARVGTPGFYCYTLDSDEPGVVAHTRMFSPGSGIAEDPVTGNAAGALAHYLKRTYFHQTNRFLFAQGEAMRRKGYVSVTLDGELATVSGKACLVFESSMVL